MLHWWFTTDAGLDADTARHRAMACADGAVTRGDRRNREPISRPVRVVRSKGQPPRKAEPMRHRSLSFAALAAALLTGIAVAPRGADALPRAPRDGYAPGRPVRVEVLSPRAFEKVGVANAGFTVDLNLRYPSLRAAGFNGLQLTGPAGHANIPPAPGAFGAGADEKVPGLVVLLSTTVNGGPGQNLAGVFNLTTVGNRNRSSATIQETWLVGAAGFGTGRTQLTVAVVDDLDHDGVFDDAPASVPDADHDGKVDARDLNALGVASNIATVSFSINPDAA
jgi:hypothetical protein